MSDSPSDAPVPAEPRLSAGDWGRVALVALATAIPVLLVPDADARSTMALIAVIPGGIAVVASALWLRAHRGPVYAR